MITIKVIVAASAGIIFGIILGFLVRKRITERQFESINNYSKKIINDAHRQAKTIKKEAMLRAKDTIYQMKLDFEKETKEKKGLLQAQERRLFHKEESLDKKIHLYENRENSLFKREKDIGQIEDNLKKKHVEYEELIIKQRNQLEKVAGISGEEAKKLLVLSMEDEAKHDSAKLIRRVENDARETAKRKAQEIIALAIKRYAGDYVAEKTVSVVDLPNEEMKGRIIGREGRNIRAIEAATGIDLIIDDTPEAVILSGFNPVRREVAKVSLERLIEDGRIHPARIEEIVKKVDKEIETSIKEAGEQATFDVGVHGIDSELVKLLGRLKYRSSYAQNVLQHSKEVSFICGVMASELGVNVKKAKRAGLLHDIGKIGIDDSILGKNDKLTEQEYKKIKEHTVMGANIIEPVNFLKSSYKAIYHHHERYDGGGYPDGIKDKEIPLSARIIAVADAFDAMGSDRPYRKRLSKDRMMKELKEQSGKQFDPEVVAAFISILNKREEK